MAPLPARGRTRTRALTVPAHRAAVHRPRRSERGHAAGGGLEKRMWGDVFGMCTDAFGVVRLVDIAGRPS
ncbi:hypothetical protein [Streptomyces hydrogenans]|uniref:hypothetical protein n=1 Tax=Streptomyces hydrogenans TaxID=1873719 RepID=UPI00278C04D8|nr:hypothetical protein [Streptomyces hydrogenans]